MCGIAGYIDYAGHSSQQILKSMTDSMIRRGPDDAGDLIYNYDYQVGLGHRRLSIIDLSPTGRMPMISHSKQYAMVFNGEIYNHKEIANELKNKGHRFNGTSDSEILLTAIQEWGFDKAIKMTIGMFAIAVWDSCSRELLLARDRLGEKPLYYGWQGKTFLFASELKAIEQHPACQKNVDREALTSFLRYRYVPSPFSIYKGIFKLRPGQILSISTANPNFTENDFSIDTYWDVKDKIAQGAEHPYSGTPEEAVSELESLLEASIKKQMIADVPLGAFLSGGTDSSLIVALMQKLSSNSTQTFSIGFDDKRFNEAHYANNVAKHLGTNHHELYVSNDDLLNLLPKLPDYYSEPFADSSQIPTCLLAQFASKSVKVALSGDGGDEFFLGYNSYYKVAEYNNIRKIPHFLRKMVAYTAKKMALCGGNGRYLKRIGIINKFFDTENEYDLFKIFSSCFTSPEEVILNSEEKKTQFDMPYWYGLTPSIISNLAVLDCVQCFPDDILTKTDRAAMAFSLETRIPILDHNLAEFSFSLPFEYRFRDGIRKWPLRKLLSKYVPDELIDRPKKGFSVPLDEWLRGPLYEWCMDMLSPGKLKIDGFFNVDIVNWYVQQHMKTDANYSSQIWNLLMYQSWLHR